MYADEFRFAEYYNYVNNCVKQVQFEMSLGNIEDEETLLQFIDSSSQIFCTNQAFKLFNNHSPYELADYVTLRILAKNFSPPPSLFL